MTLGVDGSCKDGRMGSGCCKFGEKDEGKCARVGREDEGVSSNRPESGRLGDVCVGRLGEVWVGRLGDWDGQGGGVTVDKVPENITLPMSRRTSRPPPA